MMRRLIGAVEKAKPRLSRPDFAALRDAREYVAKHEKAAKSKAAKPKSKPKPKPKPKVEVDGAESGDS